MPATVLTDTEARILGSLVEKSITTPDQYPLSLNAVTNACNQKTSRDPVMNIDEASVARALSTLREKTLASPRSEPGSRVTKFSHRIENLIGGGNSREIALVCVLLLRGPQTPGELRVRTDRLCDFASVQDVETILQELANRPDGPFVVRLPRQPGQKEARYRHLFVAGAADIVAQAAAARTEPPPAPVAETYGTPAGENNVHQLADLIGGRFQTLEQRVAYLEARVSTLENRVRGSGGLPG